MNLLCSKLLLCIFFFYYFLFCNCSLNIFQNFSENLLKTWYIYAQNLLKPHPKLPCWKLVEPCLHSGRWKTSCKSQYKIAEYAIYTVYYTKYLDIFRNKMAFMDCETCQFIEFSKTKFSKTAGLWRWQQVNSDFL